MSTKAMGNLKIIQLDISYQISVKNEDGWYYVCSYDTLEEAKKAAETYLKNGFDINIEEVI